jgi:hypothetical protein
MINWVSPCLSFFLSASITTTYFFIVPTYTSIIITLEPYTLNVEFHHFIPKFYKISSLYGHIERGVWGWKEAQKQGDKLQITLVYILTYTPQNIYTWPGKCIWQIFKLILCKCKWFTITRDLHTYTWLLTHTHTILVLTLFSCIYM